MSHGYIPTIFRLFCQNVLCTNTLSPRDDVLLFHHLQLSSYWTPTETPVRGHANTVTVIKHLSLCVNPTLGTRQSTLQRGTTMQTVLRVGSPVDGIGRKASSIVDFFFPTTNLTWTWDDSGCSLAMGTCGGGSGESGGTPT